MSRPTPETDAELNLYFRHGEAHQISVAWIEFARKLERERDEAREAAAKWESSSDAMERAGAEQARRADENREWALKAERERNEAREKYDKLATEHMLVVNKLCEERDEWAAMCGRYKQERDELLNEIKRLRLNAQREAEHHDRMVKELESLYDKLKS